MAQWPVCSAQNTDTDVKASSDGSGWGSSSGCENQGSCARQGATMDTGDSGCGKEPTVVAKAAVTQGSCVVCAQLVRTGHSGWQGSATVAAGAMAQAGAQGSEAQGTAETGRGNERCENLTPPPLLL